MQQEKIKQTDPDKKYRRVLAASTLAGDSVRNAAGEDLGKLDELMIDIPSGRVAYAVLSFGGVLRMGNKLFAVPWSALKVDEDEKCFILNVPGDMQKIIVYVAGVPAEGSDSEAAKALVKFLTSAAAATV